MQLAITASQLPYTLLKKWVCRGYQRIESNTLCSPAASQQDQLWQMSLRRALCSLSLPLLIIAPLSALCSSRIVSSPAHSRSVTLYSTPCCVHCIFVKQMKGNFLLFSYVHYVPHQRETKGVCSCMSYQSILMYKNADISAHEGSNLLSKPFTYC